MSWNWYPKSNPRRPAQGIRAQSQHGHFGRTWWAGKWLTSLERLVDRSRLARGRSYARSGQVLNLDIEPGRVRARVQGSRPAPYKVNIRVRPISDADWEKVADAMARQAIFSAKLLAGEMPQNIEQAFATAGVSLFPAQRGDLITDCTCPDSAKPCKHAAAVYYLLGEQFDADPFILFRLRGKTKEQLITMLRARRTVPERPQASGQRPRRPREEDRPRPAEPVAPPERIVPLEQTVDHFWTMPERLDDFHVEIKGAEVDAAPIKRLGAPGFWRGRVDFVEAFSTAYHEIGQAALVSVLGRDSE